MALPILLGMETEYAVNGMTRDGTPVDRSRLVQQMLVMARQHYPHLRDGSGGGLFLANGGRLYMDRGAHPEFATPECDDPHEVVRYVRAGEALLLDLARRVQAEDADLREVNVFRCNVDYGRSGVTWGCHESYLYRRSPQDLPRQLIPHLVSRLIYSGAGGFNPLSAGLEFTLSPRAWLLPNASSPDSTGNRGIFHLKDESLSGPGWHRLHLICGDSLCSDTALLLKLGATALVVAAIEAGLRPGDAVQLASPVDALQTFAADPDGRASVPLAGGGRLRAVELQRHYLAEVAEVDACRPAGLLPSWADEICRLWREQLDALEARDASLQYTLDWSIKRALYQRWARERMSWEVFPRWGDVLKRLERAVARMQRRAASNDEELLSAASPVRREMHRLAPLLAAENLQWHDVRAFLGLRHQLLEADVRFGQLGETGVFEQLDRSRVLSHRRAGCSPGAPDQTPTRGRARVRGQWIRQLHASGEAGRYRCDWACVWDEVTGRQLDLSDPFVAAADW